MKRIIAYSIIALLQASVSLAQTSPKPKLQKRQKYEWVLDDADAWVNQLYEGHFRSFFYKSAKSTTLTLLKMALA